MSRLNFRRKRGQQMSRFKLLRSTIWAALCLRGVGLTILTPALPLVSDQFARTGQTETLAAPRTAFGGVSTTQRWSGLIEVIAAGVGNNSPVAEGTTDAFYYFLPQCPALPLTEPNWERVLSFTGCAAGLGCGALSILRFLAFTEDVGFVHRLPTLSQANPSAAK